MAQARRLAWLIPVLLLLGGGASAARGGPHEPARYGAALGAGTTYDPVGDIEFVLASAVALYDYDAVWPHRAPAPLRFKVEATLGATTAPSLRALCSANVFALYYLERLSSRTFRPYAEAGVGLIYTDFRVEGQGLRFNFNPQAGLGAEFGPEDGGGWFAAVRLLHLSNGDLYRENRGVNGALFAVGRYLP